MMNIRFLKIGLVMVLGMGVLASSVHAATKIANTKHNLSNWGQYSVKASGTTLRDTEVCIFCHAPHNADSSQAPLWNHEDTSSSFGMASSLYLAPGDSYMDTTIGGISKKCLSCHDGTVAVGAVNGTAISVKGPGNPTGSPDYKLSASNNSGNYTPYLGTNLSSGHIISFTYTDALVTDLNGATKYNQAAFVSFPDSDSTRWTMLDRNRKMQCHTCHDPHNDWCNDSSKRVGNDPLWRLACGGAGVGNGSVCEKCHNTAFDYYTSPKSPF